MKFDAVVISVLYTHFGNMQKKGRQVVPWFQTTWALALTLVIMVVLAIRFLVEIMHSGNYKINMDEPIYILLFVGSIMLFFYLIKRYYFTSSRHLSYMDQFSSLSARKQKIYKYIILGITYLLPFVLLYSLFM